MRVFDQFFVVDALEGLQKKIIRVLNDPPTKSYHVALTDVVNILRINYLTLLML